RTTKENIKELMRHNGINEEYEKLPRTIRDSIRLVTDLGERYLWVDALCIIQNSDRSWALNSRVMNVVYGNAYFTICAADGNDANAGLQALGFLRPIAHPENIAFYSLDVRLKLVRPAEHYIHGSRWSTRGWTFQERLLSPRTLIFADGRMFFQCRCTARCADIITEDEHAGWSMDFSHSPSLILQKLDLQPLLVYKQALELYMKRRLTFPKDILAAFTGIGNLVCDALGGTLVYGLPSSHFDWALLWEFRDAALRRDKEEHEQFPSWSWCGWKNEQMDFQYKDTMLAGIEENLHDWLMNHTWITWYIRDGNGNIRLVWGGNTSDTASPKVEATWRGYSLPQTPTDESPTDSSLSSKHDAYGRTIRSQHLGLTRSQDFKLILNECPFDVEIVAEVEALSPHRTERDMPFLQFYSWSAFFRIREDRRFRYAPHQNFHRYNIEDYKDDWCGTIMLDSVWALRKDLELDDPMEFIAISDAKQFHADEYDDWSSYIPMERKESTWDLYYVLLVEYHADIAYRVGLGKIYKEAFENSCKPEGKRWKEFILG
ncbi:HET-domain-containing protein, partial [Polyplosphaeria fusca]